MKTDEPKKSELPLAGGGSYSATRRYSKHLGDAIESGDFEVGAEEARRAVDGLPGAELERAAEEAKRGPKSGGGSATTGQDDKVGRRA